MTLQGMYQAANSMRGMDGFIRGSAEVVTIGPDELRSLHAQHVAKQVKTTSAKEMLEILGRVDEELATTTRSHSFNVQLSKESLKAISQHWRYVVRHSPPLLGRFDPNDPAEYEVSLDGDYLHIVRTPTADYYMVVDNALGYGSMLITVRGRP